MTLPTDRWPSPSELKQELIDLAGDARYAGLLSQDSLAEDTWGDATVVPPIPAMRMNYVRLGRLGAGRPDRARILFTGGVHAREWAPPRILVMFISRLLDKHLANQELVIGASTFTAPQIHAIIDNVDLYIAPLINPDGYQFTQTPAGRVGDGWRKNRRPPPTNLAAASCRAGSAEMIGVDINRNFDVLWKFTDFYTAAYLASPEAAGRYSIDPCNEIFSGFVDGERTTPFSEPETRNVKALMDTVDPQFYVDVHMYGGLIEHAWGTALNGAVADPTPPLDPGRVRDGNSGAFREKIGSNFLAQIRALASSMADGAHGAANRSWTPIQGCEPPLGYPVTGAADDYASSRNLGVPNKPQIKAFTIECGDSFLPDFGTEHDDLENEVHAALLALLRVAASGASPSATPTPTPVPTSCCRQCP